MVSLVITRYISRRWTNIKPNFTTRWGTFAYEHMPFGLINMVATFQRAMQKVFDDLVGKII